MEFFLLLLAVVAISGGMIAVAFSTGRADRLETLLARVRGRISRTLAGAGPLETLLARARGRIGRTLAGARLPRADGGLEGGSLDPEEVAMRQSYTRQISLAERRNDSAEVERLRLESESAEEAWRAQRALRGKAPKRLPQYSLGEGFSAQNTRELRELLDRSRTLTTLSPEDWVIRGNSYMAVEDASHAAEVYRLALQERTDDVDTAFHLAIALGQGDRQREALAMFDRVLETRPEDPDALTGRANALADLGQRQDALESYRQALAASPGHIDALYNRANLLADDGQLDAAILAYDETLEVRADLPDVHNDKGNTLSLMGQHDEALDAYDRAVKLRPSYARAFYNRGVTLARLGRLEEAVAGFERCLRLRLDIPEAHYGKGVALARLDRHSDAVIAFDRALALRPSSAEAMLQKARAHSRLGQEREAMDWLAQAIRASASTRNQARDEPDFDALRTSPTLGREFEDLVGG